MNDKFSEQFVFYSGKVEAKSVDEGEKTRYFVKGYVSTGDLDLVNDIVTKECKNDIDKQFKSRNIKLDFEHETLRKSKNEDEIDMRIGLTKSPLGKAISADKDEKGNFIEFELNPAWKKYDAKGNVVKTFNEVWNEIKSGFLDAFSIAYVPVRTQFKNMQGILARLLDKINIVNVALTGNPVNPGASMVTAFAKSLEYIKNQEGETMDEELKNQVSVLTKSVEDLKASVVALQKKASEEDDEKKKEKEEEEMEKKKAEKKAKEDSEEEEKEKEKEKKKEAEEKSFKIDYETMKKEHAEMKAILEAPQFKSMGAQQKQVPAGNQSSKGPLDLI